MKPDAPAVKARPAADTPQNVEAFCKQCHMPPDAKSIPDKVWERVVPRMYELAGAAQPNSMGLPSVEFALEYYLQQAPSKLTLPRPEFSPQSSRAFSTRHVRPSEQAPPNPGVSSVRAVQWRRRGPQSLIMTDMRHGVVVDQPILGMVKGRARPGQIVGVASFPSDSAAVDLDRDGKLDILVSELGTFGPAETSRGGVVWFRQVSSPGKSPRRFEKHQLLSGIGRVAALRVHDLDGDKDPDIVIGMFGLLASGKVMWMENLGRKDGRGIPQFALHDLDVRPGASDLSIADIDGDGRPDIVAVLGQHLEEVMVYLNLGQGKFRPERIYRAPNPDWGMMRSVTADLDKDGDIDILVANGDVMDTPTPKYFHGIRWYENLGNMKFKTHLLTKLMGAAAVQVGDMDGDGDLDVVATAFAPAEDERVRIPDGYEGVVWLEQTKPREFVVHRIEGVKADHPAIALVDLDRDRDLDVVTANFMVGPTELYREINWLTIFLNQKAE